MKERDFRLGCGVSRDYHYKYPGSDIMVSNSPMFHACQECTYDKPDCFKNCKSKTPVERPCLKKIML